NRHRAASTSPVASMPGGGRTTSHPGWGVWALVPRSRLKRAPPRPARAARARETVTRSNLPCTCTSRTATRNAARSSPRCPARSAAPTRRLAAPWSPSMETGPARLAGVRAMVLERVREPLLEQTVAQPEPGPGQALVRVQACGVCRTDLHVVDGE